MKWRHTLDELENGPAGAFAGEVAYVEALRAIAEQLEELVGSVDAAAILVEGVLPAPGLERAARAELAAIAAELEDFATAKSGFRRRERLEELAARARRAADANLS